MSLTKNDPFSGLVAVGDLVDEYSKKDDFSRRKDGQGNLLRDARVRAVASFPMGRGFKNYVDQAGAEKIRKYLDRYIKPKAAVELPETIVAPAKPVALIGVQQLQIDALTRQVEKQNRAINHLLAQLGVEVES